MHVKLFSFFSPFILHEQNKMEEEGKKHETKKTFLIKKRNGMKAVF